VIFVSINPNNPTANATETFNEDFNTLNLWNGKTGVWDTNYWYNVTGDPNAVDSLPSNGEQEWYIDSNNPQQTANGTIKPWTVNNGVLSIKASPTPSNIASAVKNYPYISGQLQTHNSFSQTYGLFEAKMELPAGQGFWPAFWLLPESGAWPPEIDVMENLGQDTSNYYTTFHSNQLPNTYQSAKIPVTTRPAGTPTRWTGSRTTRPIIWTANRSSRSRRHPTRTRLSTCSSTSRLAAAGRAPPIRRRTSIKR
jgi:beta-glucanase (GH16 family)